MPTSTFSVVRKPSSDLISRLDSSGADVKLKALREVKNQIIGNRTKKLTFIKLGAVPAVADILSSASDANLLVQSAAALGSFACGVDAGVRAVLEAGAFPLLIRLLSNSDEKVVDAGARSLRMIYQSKLAPKYDFLQQKDIDFLISLLNSENENVTGLGATIIIHSCKTTAEQKALFHAGVLEKLICLLYGSLSQRDASLESLVTILKDNAEGISKFMEPIGKDCSSSIIELMKDRSPRTRLLASMCLIVIRNSSPCYLQDIGIRSKLIHNLLELLDDPGRVGEEALFAFSTLIEEKEDLQKLAFEANAIDKLSNRFQEDSLHPKRIQGVLLALAHLCSKLECCRSRFLSLQVLNLMIDALRHDSDNVRIAACICLRNVSRSIKILSAGHFMNEKVVIPLVQLFRDPSNAVQIAALGALSNIVVNFTKRREMFIECGVVKELGQLSKSMDSAIRLNSLWALRNLMFLSDHTSKERIFAELRASLLASLISDSEASVQEQAIALVRNLVDGCIDSIKYAFAEDCVILEAIGRQLRSTSKAEIGIQGMYVLSNVASGNEFHKEAVMKQLFRQEDDTIPSYLIKFLQSNDNQLRTACIWAVVNLTLPSSPCALSRFTRFLNTGIVSQIKNMVNDPCLDVKLRVRTALGQFMAFTDSSSMQ